MSTTATEKIIRKYNDIAARGFETVSITQVLQDLNFIRLENKSRRVKDRRTET